MATRKVTVTLPEEQLAAIRDLVAGVQTGSVSAFVQNAVALALDEVAGWRDYLHQSLAATGGPLSDEERGWADRILSGEAGSGTSVA
jgi:Arc/MetJ-type ribon-helix-helix transcriptional regulator